MKDHCWMRLLWAGCFTLLLLCGCTSTAMVKCDGHLQPINVPASVSRDAKASSKTAAAPTGVAR